jgi:arginyl-tRNA synthetase
MRDCVQGLIEGALQVLRSRTSQEIPVELEYDLEIPSSAEHGDLASNLALRLSRSLRRKPLEIAEELKRLVEDRIPSSEMAKEGIEKIVVVPPGFLNFFLKIRGLIHLLPKVRKEDDRYGRSTDRHRRRILIEFVSANPTGPLTIAHGRQAALGDTLANVLEAAGDEVFREYYLNDTGRQMDLLGQSVRARALEHLGEEASFPEEGYRGEYIKDLAKIFLERNAEKFRKMKEKEVVSEFAGFAECEIMAEIVEDLKRLGVKFESIYSERALRESGKIEKMLEELKSKKLSYENGGALWFQASELGDEKDRVLRKSDGTYTYLAPDITYHCDKFERGFDLAINLWGPDHHGYVPRLQGALKALGYPETKLKVLIVQLTTLTRKGEPVRMSTRAGEFVSVRELMDEVGVDAARFFFLMRRVESHLDFDLDLAKSQSQENPVYYLQYAHARISSILNYAGRPVTDRADLSLIRENEEKELLKLIDFYPMMLVQAARALEPYRVVDYLRALAATFHRFYTLHRVVSADDPLTEARLLLVDAVRIVLRNGLRILGVSQPEKM